MSVKEIGLTVTEQDVAQALREGLAVREKTLSTLLPVITQTAQVMIDALRSGHKLLICGNGGSAAEAQHFSGELVGRYKAERRPLPAIALSTDPSIVTCIGNDYGYEHVFARQVLAHGQPGDVLVGLTTSGKSVNVLRAFEAASERGIMTIALAGEAGLIGTHADHVVSIPSRSTARVQEEHLAIIHCWCDAIDAAFQSN
jgi:D-sedoheptulose 7-phosphate isomerase